MAKYIIIAVLAVLAILLGASIAKDLKLKGRKATEPPKESKPLTRKGDILLAVFNTDDETMSKYARDVADMIAVHVGTAPVQLAAGSKLPALDDMQIVLLGAPATGGEWPESMADLMDDSGLIEKVLVPFGVCDVTDKPVLDKALRKMPPDVRVLKGYFASAKEMASDPRIAENDVFHWLWDLDLETK